MTLSAETNTRISRAIDNVHHPAKYLNEVAVGTPARLSSIRAQ